MKVLVILYLNNWTGRWLEDIKETCKPIAMFGPSLDTDTRKALKIKIMRKTDTLEY